MKAAQLVHMADFSQPERRLTYRQNAVSLLVQQATFCADACLTLAPDSFTGDMFSETEAQCVEHCTSKLYGSDKLLKSYLPSRVRQSGNLTLKELQRRLENPTDANGPYFLN